MNERFYTRREIAAHFGVSTHTVSNWIAAGLLHPTYVGPRLLRFTSTELDNFITRSATNADAR